MDLKNEQLNYEELFQTMQFIVFYLLCAVHIRNKINSFVNYNS